MEWILSFLRLFALGLLALAAPIALISVVLGIYIKSPWIRLPLAFVIWGAVLGSLSPPSPHSIPKWKLQLIRQTSNLRQIGDAWLFYKSEKEYHGDSAHAIPERFSQLFPGPVEAKCFFDPQARDYHALCEKAAADPTEVDRSAQFDYFAGQVGWMVAASKVPIEKPDKPSRPFRAILEVNGSAGIWPEEEYQRRLQMGRTPFAN